MSPKKRFALNRAMRSCSNTPMRIQNSLAHIFRARNGALRFSILILGTASKTAHSSATVFTMRMLSGSGDVLWFRPIKQERPDKVKRYEPGCLYRMKISIINFSSRSNGNCHNISKVVEKEYSDCHEVYLYEMSELKVTPCGKCDYECFDEYLSCPHIDDDIVPLYSAVCSSDLPYLIFPNYCDYPCAEFFMFNERSQCFFRNNNDMLEKYLSANKKFIVVSNTEKENFRQIFRYHVTENIEPDTLFLPPKNFNKVSVNGDLMDSTEAIRAVISFTRYKDNLGTV